MEPAVFLNLNPLYQVYILISFTVAATSLYLSQRWTSNTTISVIHASISVWTGVATLNYAYQWIPGDLTIYLDWIVTTPLLVLTLAFTLTELRFEPARDIAGAVLLQALVVVAGFVAFTTGQVGWFFLGSAAFAAVFYIVAYSIGSEAGAAMQGLAVLFFALWAGYPVLWYYGVFQERLAEDTVTLGLVVLPLISKHLFGLLDIYLLRE